MLTQATANENPRARPNEHEFEPQLVLKHSDAAERLNASECGLYSLIAATKSLGMPSNPFKLFLPEFLSQTSAGSTPTDLIKAADRIGLHATYSDNLNMDCLRNSVDPIILLLENRSSNHWVAFLGFEANEILIYDHSNSKPLHRVSIEQVHLQWRGKGVVVSKTPITLLKKTSLTFSGLFPFISFAAFIALAGIYFDKKRSFAELQPTAKQNLANAFTFWIFALTALSAHLLFWPHPWSSMSYSNWVVAPFTDIEIPEINIDEIRILKNNGERVLFVDARNSHDAKGFGPADWVNIPADCSVAHFNSVLHELPVDIKKVVYCNSRTCGFDDFVAKQLITSRVSNVHIFNGGAFELIRAFGAASKPETGTPNAIDTSHEQ